MPIAFVIGIAALAFFFAEAEPLTIAVNRVVAQSQSFTFLAVPFFIFAGNLMNVSGITQRLLSLARLVTRGMFGGTAQISVVMSTLMGGVSGSATADAAMETRILGPEMMRLGYKKGYICAVNCLTALITATIPPSLGLIIFGFVGEVSIGRLFAAGIIPGFLMMVFLMVTTSLTSRYYRYDPPKKRKELPVITIDREKTSASIRVWAKAGLILAAIGAFITHYYLINAGTAGFIALILTVLFSLAAIGLIIFNKKTSLSVDWIFFALFGVLLAAVYYLGAVDLQSGISIDTLNDDAYARQEFSNSIIVAGGVLSVACLFLVSVFKFLPLILQELLDNLTESIWALLFPIILILGIRFGLFTPSEAGAFAVVYAIVIGKFVYKELSLSRFLGSLKTSFRDNGAIMLIIALSGPFSYAITLVQLPVVLSNLIFGITNNPQLLTLIMLGFLFITGMFVDSNVNFLLLTPIFLPMVTQVGMDPVHFGVLMATIVTLGVMTPPIGSAIYTVCGIIDCPVEEYTRYALPFLAAILLELAILVFLPDVVLWIPNLIFGPTGG
jgi:TRAP-type C4-dicarboxylate transport system permease large subunit